MKSNQTEIYLLSEQKGLFISLFIKLLFLVFALFALTGCNKEETPFVSYLRMMLNGERVESDYYIRASEFVPPYIGKTQKLGIYATWKHKKPQEGTIEIELYDFDNTIGHKPFTDYSVVTVTVAQPDGNGGWYSAVFIASGNDVNLTLQEVSEEYVKGIFDLTAKSITGQGTYESLVITGGEFHIDRKQ